MVSLGVWDVWILNPFIHVIEGHATQILPFLPVAFLAKTPITGGVWVVSGCVCLVSEMCLRTEEISGCSNTKSIGKIWNRPYSDIALSSSTLCCIKTSMFGSVWMVSEGVWMMSGWCLRVSGWCLDGVWWCLGRHQYQICWQKNILSHDTLILLFLPVPCIV